ncbi:hypothetical protein FC43_GL001299 [Limosilactobacillus ingluviei DSM 15946]|uniref:Uncharacterized protein n=1 Tax=Limosilactobacillus ingluviei DSM 15946 TaxID=1423760 RepID=A0A0R1UBC9_9LACO|nr:hypothetical protein FC43_GL001299 [Limosilactobacillus ingluviei DSM 15946]
MPSLSHLSLTFVTLLIVFSIGIRFTFVNVRREFKVFPANYGKKKHPRWFPNEGVKVC